MLELALWQTSVPKVLDSLGSSDYSQGRATILVRRKALVKSRLSLILGVSSVIIVRLMSMQAWLIVLFIDSCSIVGRLCLILLCVPMCLCNEQNSLCVVCTYL